MRHVVTMTVEEFLASGTDLRNTQPTKWARETYEAIKAQYRVILFSANDEELTRMWLEREFFKDFALLITYVPIMEYEDWRIDQVRQLLADGYELSMVFDYSDKVIHGANELGVPGMRVSPSTRQQGWRGHTTEVRPWGEVASTVGVPKG